MPINPEIFENEPLPEGLTSTNYGHEMGYRIRKDLDLEKCKAETTASAIKTIDAIIADYVKKDESNEIIAMVTTARLGLADFDITIRFREFGRKTTFVIDLCNHEELDDSGIGPVEDEVEVNKSNDEGSAD